MDLNLFFKVLWRQWFVVIPGVIAAIALSFMTIASVDTKDGFKVRYRASQEYVAYSTLFVTKPGFPWGRLNTAGDQGRFTSLAIIYSNLVSSDPVTHLIQPNGPIDGTVEAAPVLLPSSGEALPLIKIAAITKSPNSAVALARNASTALRTWIRRQQTASSTPDSQRVVVQEISRADRASVFAKRSKTLAIVVFLAVMLATIALAFVLENFRAGRAAGARAEDEGADAEAEAELGPAAQPASPHRSAA
jgi:hypothetical protein